MYKDAQARRRQTHNVDSAATDTPVISLAGLRSGKRSDLERVGAAIGRAARHLGFFSVVDHGISQPLIDAVFAMSERFFSQSLEVKERFSVANSTSYRGYVRFGEEKLDPALPGDVKECFNIGPDLAPDDPDIVAGKPFHAVNQWPELVGFRPALVAYARAALELVVLLHRAIATDLGIEIDYFDSYFTHAVGVVRLLHYSPHPGTFDGSVYGAGTHTDYGNLTLLAQDATGGLEVRKRDGTWILVPPLAGTFVCNIGDCLMRWTNDVYVSTPHRVVNRSGRERYSIAYFGDPNSDALVSCLPACLRPGDALKYPPLTYAQYLRSRYDATYTVPALS